MVNHLTNHYYINPTGQLPRQKGPASQQHLRAQSLASLCCTGGIRARRIHGGMKGAQRRPNLLVPPPFFVHFWAEPSFAFPAPNPNLPKWPLILWLVGSFYGLIPEWVISILPMMGVLLCYSKEESRVAATFGRRFSNGLHSFRVQMDDHPLTTNDDN